MGLQVHIPTRSGTFRPCPKCGREPRHVAYIGAIHRQPCAFRAHAVKHQIECGCGFKTPLQAALHQCLQLWNAPPFTQACIPIHKPEPLRRAA
jgi:hypothetical protein